MCVKDRDSMRERERVCVCVRERERKREIILRPVLYVCTCVCACVFRSHLRILNLEPGAKHHVLSTAVSLGRTFARENVLYLFL